MRRRSLLAGGVAAAASSVVGRFAHSQSTDASAQDSWNLCGPSNRYVIRLRGPAVVGDCYSQGGAVGDDVSEEPPGTTARPFERAATILHGPERQPVSWR